MHLDIEACLGFGTVVIAPRSVADAKLSDQLCVFQDHRASYIELRGPSTRLNKKPLLVSDRTIDV